MTRRLLATLSLLVALALTACNTGPSAGPLAVDPSTIALTPFDGEVVASLDRLTAVFPVSVDPESANSAAFTLRAGATSVEGSVAYDADTRTLTFTPDAPLVAGTAFTATIRKSLRFVSNHKLSDDLVWSFSTAEAAPTAVAIAISDDSFVYDGTAKGVTVTTTPPGVEHSVTYSQGGTEVAAPTGAGVYDVTVAVTADGFFGSAEGTLTIDRAPLTVKVTNAAKVYDGQPYSGQYLAEYEGFVDGETADVLSGALSFGGEAMGAVTAGAYEITASGLSSTNYEITYVPGTLRILKTGNVITVTARPATKVYDGRPFTGFEVDYSGFVGGDDVGDLSGELTFTGPATTATDAGDHYFEPAGLGSDNYDFEYVGAHLTIGRAPLTVTADDKGKTYDGQPYSGFTTTYSAFAPGEGPADLGGTLTFVGEGATAVDAGPHTITPAGLTSDNYEITFESGTLAISPAPLVVRGNDAEHVYDGQPFGELEVSYVGLVDGDSLGGMLALSGDAVSAKDVGEHEFMPGGLTSPNYDIEFEAGTITITPAQLVVRGDPATKPYDGTPYTGFAATYDGLVPGDALDGTLQFEGAALSAADAGTYEFTPGGVSSANYDVSFENGTLTIGRVPLTITADDKSKTYDGQPFTGFTASYDGFVSGEGPGVLEGVLVYGGSAVGESGAGEYSIVPNGLAADNYDIEFVQGTLVIEKAALTVSAVPVSMTYTGLPYDFGAYQPTYAGFADGEGPEVLGGALQLGQALTAYLPGTYDIEPGGLTADDYEIEYVSSQLTIDPMARSSVSPLANQSLFDYPTNVRAVFPVDVSDPSRYEVRVGLQRRGLFSSGAFSSVAVSAPTVSAGEVTFVPSGGWRSLSEYRATVTILDGGTEVATTTWTFSLAFDL